MSDPPLYDFLKFVDILYSRFSGPVVSLVGLDLSKYVCLSVCVLPFFLADFGGCFKK